MLDDRHLENLITDEQRQFFEEQGYLIVEDAVPMEMVGELETCLDRIHAERIAAGHSPHADMFVPNFVGRDPAFIELLDWHRTFPLVWGILGWNLYLYHSHCGVTPPPAPGAEMKPRTLGWHQDSGRVNVEMESHPRPRLSLKVAYWLSDVSEPGRGNFYVLPGSHLHDRLERPTDGVSNPDGAMPVCCRPGDAVLFDRRLWHARSDNSSQVTRKVLFYGYGYRWIRTKDDMTIPPEVFERSDPVRRQLLGGGVNANGHFSPTDADVPLKVWLQEHGVLST
jgi:ectoine hydroxylase-related dioxygenase (phytanoyl-CoA dioxygenase family)